MTPSLEIWGKSMGKKIIIATMLVLTLLLLMPSIPAVQQKSIEEGIKQNIQERLDEINLNDLKDMKGFFLKHPIVYILALICQFRALRGLFLAVVSTSYDYYEGYEIIHPLVCIRGIWLLGTGLGFYYIVYTFVNIMGWEWE